MDDEIVDAFDCKMAFKELLDTLTGSANAVSKVASFALAPQHRAHHLNLFECIKDRMEEIPTMNRLNLLWVLDALCQQGKKVGFKVYYDLLRQDLEWVFATVVPDNDDAGLVNLTNVRKIIKVWKNKGIFHPSELENVERRLATFQAKAPITSETPRSALPQNFSKSDILRRIEEDRDRVSH
ncbi:hypothetical protein HDU67_010240 [Dinochytrium kinnereticum]|nr:hypothetical protein HDU67_010240 [Dinochytrium kinnereticum]